MSAGLSVGQVVNALKSDFPDISASKIRFLDTQGLVSPSRTPSGYRRYDNGDLDRLRFVLTCQRERYWPLSVIRDALDAHERGLPMPTGPEARLDPPVLAEQVLDEVVDHSPSPASAAMRLTRAELMRACGLGEADVAALESFGLLRARSDGFYGAHALQAARAAAALLLAGLEPRHLRPFRLAAQREVDLIEQLVRTGDDAEQEAMLRRFIGLHLALVRSSFDPE